jgi:SAM-dependent methyltransferase
MSADATSSFTGAVPANYARHLVPFLFEPFAADLARRAPAAAARVLELACGTGVVARHLLARLPENGTLTATDLNPAMIEQARATVADPRVVWRQADMQALPFGPSSFDVAVCQFGFMFLPDKQQGFAEARRVLGVGGTLLASVWCSLADNAYANAAHQELCARFPKDPPRFLETPHGWCDPAAISATARAAGFAEVLVERVTLPGRAESATSVATGFLQGSPLAHALAERKADVAATVAAVAKRIAAVGGERPFQVPLHALVITAR